MEASVELHILIILETFLLTICISSWFRLLICLVFQDVTACPDANILKGSDSMEFYGQRPWQARALGEGKKNEMLPSLVAFEIARDMR